MSAPPRLALLALAVGCAGSSCIQRGYPLGQGGTVDVRPDVAGNLFAADALDANGKPLLPRQDPHSTGVTLSLAETGQAAYGAFVEVRVEPSEALTLTAEKGEVTKTGVPTCAFTEGTFRCTATEQGASRFTVSSESDWSGDAKIIVTWADQTKEQPIKVLPAGLPAEATNFQLIVGGLDQNDHVLATFLPLTCTLGPVPDDLGSKWRMGQIRAREARVRATPPPGAPAVVENAPVVVEALGGEGALALAEDCADRQTRLRVLLDSTGQSSAFFLCFSDIGGTIPFGVSSGAKAIDPAPMIAVDPEPRLLRVRTLTSQVMVGVPVDLFEISAYNANRVRISMPVDIRIGDDQVLGIDAASITLAAEENPATVLQAAPLSVGSTVLHVSPRLLAMPDCASPTVTVAPPPGP